MFLSPVKVVADAVADLDALEAKRRNKQEYFPLSPCSGFMKVISGFLVEILAISPF